MSERRAALITGATAGIGLEFARQLAARGHDLVLVARDGARLEQVRASLTAANGIQVTTLSADLSRTEGLDEVCRWIAANGCDLLVHNAGFGTKGLLHKTDGAAQEAMVRLHVTATDRLMRAALPGMVARGRGHLIAVSSVASFTVSAGNVNYAATKAYQRTFMESLALELAGTGVTAQALCPGFTHTEFHDRAGMKMGAIPGWLWMSAAEVVATSLRATDRGSPTVVVPGRRWQLIVLLLRYIPRWFLRGAARRYRSTRA